MNDDLVSMMLGSEPLNEFTGTAAMGTVEIVPIGASRPYRPFRRKKKKVKEDKEKDKEKHDSIIPNDAEKIQTASGTGLGSRSTGEEGDDDEDDRALDDADLLHPSLAIVAPDCTPDADKPIDKSKVPSAPRASVPPMSTVQPQNQPAPDAGSVLKMFTGGASTMESIASVSGEALMRGGMPDPVKPTNAAVKTAMTRFNFGG